MEPHDLDPLRNSQWQEGPLPPAPHEAPRPVDRYNDAMARVLAAKQRLDARMWPKRGR
jgi:hypothetical protein